MRKQRIFDGFILILCGVVALCCCYIKNSDYNDLEDMKQVCVMEVEAPITKVDIIEETERDEDGREYTVGEHYKVFFTFEVDGKEYNGDYTATQEYKVGDTFPLYCDPDDPHEWISQSNVDMQDDRMQKILVFKIIGIMLIALGILMTIVTIIKGIRKKQ